MPAARLRALSAEPGPTADYRGYVDLVDAASGVHGWVIDTADPHAPLRVELAVDATVVAVCDANQPRNDVARRYGCPDGTPGFHFPPADLAKLRHLAPEHQQKRIAIRVADTPFELPAARELPTAGEVIGPLRRDERPARLTLGGVAPQLTLPDDVGAAAEILRERAAVLAEQPLRPISENHVGVIEAVSIDPAGTVWVAGWMHKGQPLEFAAVVIDRQKFPAAVFFTCYERPDLPDDVVGVFGAVKSQWRPGAGEDAFFLFFGEGGRFHLGSGNPVRVTGGEELLEFFEGIKPLCYGRRMIALQRMLLATHSWLPGTARVGGFAIEAWVDHLLVLPGFGCIVEGWVVSPVKRVSQFLLRVGSIVLRSDPASLYFRPRADLDEAFPHLPTLTRRAGFVAVFPGAALGEELIDPLLKVAFSDGTSTNHPIDAKVVRRLGHAASFDELLTFYPSLPCEPFFPALADAVRDEALSAASLPVPFAVADAAHAIVLAVPDDRSDAILLFDEVERQLSGACMLQGVIFVASRAGPRSEVVALFGGLAQAGVAACSLFLVDDVAAALQGLPAMLDATAAQSFVFVAAGVFLTEAGWRAALTVPPVVDMPLHLYETAESASGLASASGRASAACFGWSTSALKEWLAATPISICGAEGIEPVDPSNRQKTIAGAARRSRPQNARRVLASIDQQPLGRRVF